MGTFRQAISSALHARGRASTCISKIKAHLTAQDVIDGRISAHDMHRNAIAYRLAGFASCQVQGSQVEFIDDLARSRARLQVFSLQSLKSKPRSFLKHPVGTVSSRAQHSELTHAPVSPLSQSLNPPVSPASQEGAKRSWLDPRVRKGGDSCCESSCLRQSGTHPSMACHGPFCLQSLR